MPNQASSGSKPPYPDRQQYLVWPQASRANKRQNYKMSDISVFIFYIFFNTGIDGQSTEEKPKTDGADAPANTEEMDGEASGASKCQIDYRCTCRGNCGPH